MTHKYEWTYTAALDHHKHSRKKVKEWVRSVLEASNWFARAGIRMRYVDNPIQAKTIITYARKSEVCGGIGCTRTFPGNSRKDQIFSIREDLTFVLRCASARDVPQLPHGGGPAWRRALPRP
ncbi:MAG TPA: hypothetical protein VHM69_07690 [Rubrobacter sp.]|nr:hypothetical protein [Rubrobacter sp.]